MIGVERDVVEAAGRAVMYSLLCRRAAVPSPDRCSLLTSKAHARRLVIELPDPLAELSRRSGPRFPPTWTRSVRRT
jgi:hypothetical protein